MKKISLCSIIVLLLLLTGCGEKKVMCSYSSSNSYYGSDNVFAKYIFSKDGKVTKYFINEKMTYNKQYLEDNNLTIDSIYEQGKEYCNNVPSSKNIKCSFSKSNNTINVTLEYNLSKMSKDEIKKLELDEYLSLTEEKVKTQYKSQGFTCK